MDAPKLIIAKNPHKINTVVIYFVELIGEVYTKKTDVYFHNRMYMSAYTKFTFSQVL